MTGLRWRQKRNSDGELIKDCWITECRYTVARCVIDGVEIYQVTAPRESKPLAHPRTRGEVLKVINIDKELRDDVD